VLAFHGGRQASPHFFTDLSAEASAINAATFIQKKI
jgi:hypothetical protein